jgi:hypothetical protein
LELREAFTSKTMKQPSIRKRLSLRAISPKVEPKEWGNNAFKVTLVDLQQRFQERIGMNLSSQRHGNLYRSKKVLCIHEVPTRVGDNINKQRFYLVICFTLMSSTP